MSYTTKLAAVNVMLDVIGQSPVNSLTGLTGVDAVKAVATLDEIDRTVQLRGWEFNHEEEYPLQASATSPHEIVVPPSILHLAPSCGRRKLITRGQRIYDKDRRTFSFEPSERVPFDIIFHIPFDDLPESARSYITIRAARVYQNRGPGDPETHSYTSEDELRAKVDFERNNARSGGRTFRGNASVMRILAR